jgi:ribosomal protein S18 acetylase RimI-like enzyme
MEIARALPDSFTETAFPAIARDLDRNLTIVAALDGEVAGFLILGRKSPAVAEILWLAVAPAHQGRGAGSALLALAGDEARADGIELLEVKTLAPDVVSPEYDAARRLYARHGFLLVEVVDPFPGWDPGNPCAIYVKALRTP